jgi:RimJ/RimL family protein N-acetyltransferase
MIRLRPLAESDLTVLYRWYQDPELWSHLVGSFQARDEREAITFMRRWLDNPSSDVRLAIDDEDRLIGQIAFTGLKDDEAELHIFLGEASERGQGKGGAATRLGLSYAFQELGLKRVVLRVLQRNLVARRLYDQLGFEILKPPGHVEKDGVMVEWLAMGLSADKFIQL